MDVVNSILQKTYDDGYAKGVRDAMNALGRIAMRTAKTMAEAASQEDLEIERVTFNNPATIVFWGDKTKTVVKTQNGETFDPEKGLAMAVVKKICGNTGAYYDIFKAFCPEEEEEESPAPEQTPFD